MTLAEKPLLAYFLLIILLAFSNFSEAFIRRPNSGLMKLCPPGGESFAAAWEITCGMRRKRRSVSLDENANEENFSLIQRSSFQRISRNSGDKPVYGDKKQAKEYRAPSMTEMMLVSQLWLNKLVNITFKFCCRFGCSLRDLMPYCDPFGQWDSWKDTNNYNEFLTSQK